MMTSIAANGMSVAPTLRVCLNFMVFFFTWYVFMQASSFPCFTARSQNREVVDLLLRHQVAVEAVATEAVATEATEEAVIGVIATVVVIVVAETIVIVVGDALAAETIAIATTVTDVDLVIVETEDRKAAEAIRVEQAIAETVDHVLEDQTPKNIGRFPAPVWLLRLIVELREGL